MPRKKVPTPVSDVSNELVQALIIAINQTKPVEKKNAVNRKLGSPWAPKGGEAKLKLKRKMYQHSILIDQDMLSNEDIELLNKLKIGRFLDGTVKVYRRKDHGIDIDYPFKTASQRIKLTSQFGIRSFRELLQRCIDEAANPATYTPLDED